MANEGINSQDQRDQLNYSPDIEYTLPQINAGPYNGPSNVTVNPGQAAQPVMVEIWDKVATIVDDLTSIEEKLSSKLDTDRVPVSIANSGLVADAATKFGYNYNGYIPFQLYKTALTSPDSYEKNIIVDTYENYHSDVNGNLNAELYPDVVEMTTDWLSIAEFIRKAIMAQVVSSKDLPTTLSSDDANMAKVDAAEKALIESYLAAKKAYQATLGTLRAKYLADPEGETFYSAQYDNTQAEKALKQVERVVYSKAEVTSLVDSKVVDADVLTALIDNTVDYQPYKGSTMEILYNLLRQYPSRQSMENGLRKIQALLKLSVDSKSEDVVNMKNDLRGIASQPNKDKMNQALSNGVHLRNNVLGEVHEVMDYFDGVPEDQDSVFHDVAEQIVDSITYADKLYEDQSSDFYKIHSLDGDLRKQKLVKVIDKHSTREIYQLAQKVVDYATETGTWPTTSNLSSWLTGLMNKYNLT